MANIEYKIIGAGSSSTNPVVVSADCNDSATTICWVGRTECIDNCDIRYTDDRYCTTVNYTYVEGYDEITGNTTWSGNTVFYKIKIQCQENEEECDCEFECPDSISAYTVPKYVTSGYSDNIDVYYSYYLTCNNDSCIKREKITGIYTTKYNHNREIEFYVDENKQCGPYRVEVIEKSDSGCTSGSSIYLNISTDKYYVETTGGTVIITLYYIKTTLENDCSVKEISSSINVEWNISACDNPEIPDYCCKDHNVSYNITLNDLKELFNITEGEDTKIYYNSVEITDENPITLSITQKADPACYNPCTPETRYSVDSEKVTIKYEVGYKTEDWSGSEVPTDGCRVRVTFNYSATTITTSCQEITRTDTSSEIIEIGACEERPLDVVYYVLFKGIRITVTPELADCGESGGGDEECKYPTEHYDSSIPFVSSGETKYESISGDCIGYISVDGDCDWLRLAVDGDNIVITCNENTGAARSKNITIAYTGDKNYCTGGKIYIMQSGTGGESEKDHDCPTVIITPTNGIENDIPKFEIIV